MAQKFTDAELLDTPDFLLTAYEKRVKRGLQKGKSRQAARGHRVKEHVERRQKEQAKQRANPKEYLTSQQKQAMRRFVHQQAERMNDDEGHDPEELWERYRDDFIGRGWQWFVNVRNERNLLVAKNRRKGTRKPYLVRGYHRMIGDLNTMIAYARERDAEEWMLFYH